jgi:hypothetical protein
MVERRVDFATRKRVSEMSPDEMRRALLISDKTGLPNKRAFDEGEASPFVRKIASRLWFRSWPMVFGSRSSWQGR